MSIINTIKNFISKRKQEWDDVDQILNEALVGSYLEKM